ncbi:MAG TPA: LUD domain-containing protein [Draconibacterium sp.]|nr:LUD domain-containing protein [Draconibacterium sp.]
MKSARQKILDNLRSNEHLLSEKPDFTSPVFYPVDKPLELAFKKGLEMVNGKVSIFEAEDKVYEFLKTFISSYSQQDIYCNETEIRNKLTCYGIDFQGDEPNDKAIQIGITGCEFLIAQTGSVMVSSAQIGGRRLFVYPEIHIVIAKKNQLVEDLENAYTGISNKYKKELPSQIVLITGPSRTADIEKTLTLGAHGPKELHVLLY